MLHADKVGENDTTESTLSGILSGAGATQEEIAQYITHGIKEAETYHISAVSPDEEALPESIARGMESLCAINRLVSTKDTRACVERDG